jgi:tellurite resistance protein TerC
MVKRTFELGYRTARKVVIGVVGGSVLALGAALIVLPGPAFLVIPLGLGILSLEFAWARRWLQVARERGAQAFETARGPRRPRRRR